MSEDEYTVICPHENRPPCINGGCMHADRHEHTDSCDIPCTVGGRVCGRDAT